MNDYFERITPEPFRILGLELKPMSLGRYRNLKRFKCAFVSEDDAKAEPGDLIIGVLICAMRCDEFLLWASSRNFAKEVRRWGKRVSELGPLGKFGVKIKRLGRWWRRKHGFDMREKMLLFARYISEASRMPDYWQEEENGTVSGAHWSHGIEIVLRSELNWTAEEINETPLSKAIADYYKWLENKGVIRLIDAETMAEYEKMAAQNVAVFAKALEGIDPARLAAMATEIPVRLAPAQNSAPESSPVPAQPEFLRKLDEEAARIGLRPMPPG